MRCFTLAEHLLAAGWSVGFACLRGSLDIVPILRGKVELLEEPETSSLDAIALTRRWPSGCDILVVDHYELDAKFETSCRGWTKRIVVIDDLADRIHDCEVLIDTTLGRAAEEYFALTPPDAMVLTGASYALLRPEFAAQREEAIARRRNLASPSRVLVTFGLTDIGGATARVVAALLEVHAAFSIDVVIGAAAESRADLSALVEREPRVTLHVDPPAIADLMTRADLAIGAGGTTSWERCCLGLPTILLVLADNQRLVARRLEALGALVVAIDESCVASAVVELLANTPRLEAMAVAAATVTDGLGAERVSIACRCFASASNEVKLRAAVPDDSAAIWVWRNDPTSRTNSVDTRFIAWSEHQLWFARSLLNPRRIMLVAVIRNKPIGVVRFDRQDDKTHVISVNLAPERRGQGFGATLLSNACEAFTNLYPDGMIEAQIRTENISSRRLFEKCGFLGADTTGSFVLYRRSLADPET